MSEHQQVPAQLLETIENLSRFHREHEKFYSQAPLQRAREVQAASRALKSLAAQWSAAEPTDAPVASPFAGAEDRPVWSARAGSCSWKNENERRWRVFNQRVRELRARAG